MGKTTPMHYGEPLTSKTLQKRYPNVYKSFFAQNEVVVSSQQMLSLMAGMAWRVGGPIITQKINQRCYVGISSKGKSKQLTVNKNLAYFSDREAFEVPKYTTLPWDKALETLKEILEKRLGHPVEGLSFSILHEIPESRSLDSGVPVLFVVASFLHYGILTEEDLAEISTLPSEVIQAKACRLSKLVFEIHKYASKLRLLYQAGSTSGYIDYGSLIATSFPMLYFAEERAGTVEKPVLDLPPLNGSESLESPHFHAWGFRLDELGNIHGNFPLDVVWIYPGSYRESGAATRYTTTVVVPSFDDLRDYAKKLFSRIETTEEHAPAFLKDMDRDGVYWQYAGRGQMVSRLHLVRDLMHMYEDQYSSSKAARFLDSLNSLFYVNGPFEESPSKKLEAMIGMLREKARAVGVPIGIRAYRYGKMDGNILVYSPAQKFRKELFEIIENLKEQFGKDIHADFVSWRDGWGSEGVITEQLLMRDIRSALYPNGAKQYLVWDAKDGLQELDESSMEQHKPDLLLDTIKGKIYVGGKPVTSKDIPSQKGSIKILTHLIEHLGKPVSNKELPAKTYTSYRNDLQGKIVGPLEKLIEKRTKGTIGFTLQGQLTDFTVALTPKRLTIGIKKER